ncbi:MAG: thiolase domain-containing protein [Candidatus Aenigmarchaeota archaeon]|nr:thiolase domain-containing protein [Candidatus Aenigmarchaeota archaeon]
MRNVGIIGVGQTKFDEHWDKSLRDLIVEAGVRAIADSGMEKKSINALFVGSMSGGRFVGQEHLGALAADHLGLGHIPATRFEGACASGSLAFRHAYTAVAGGTYDVALVLGAEKMTDIAGAGVLTTLAAAGDEEWEATIGMTFAGLYALMARKHMHDFGTTKEHLAAVAVTNHKHAVKNPYAQFPSEVTLQEVMHASMIAEPLGLLDCSPISDGAAAVVIAAEDIAKKTKHPVWVLGSGQGSDTLALHDRKSFTELAATKAAARMAFTQAGVTTNDISALEVHDCFTINQIIALEDLGYCPKGKGGQFVAEGQCDLNGTIPTNTTGGLKGCGHPVGATGIRQILDLTKQLRGDSINQLKNPKYGMNLNIGGSGATAVVHILGREME